MDFLGIKGVWNDLVNYREWVHTIKQEEKNKKSIYNKFNMGRNYFYNIYSIITLPPENENLPDEIQQLRVIESLVPVNKYLDETLRFAEYLVPEFSRVYDGDEPTLNFLIVYRFAFQKLSLSWFLWRLGIIGGLLWSAFIIPWNKILEWISPLI